MAAACTDSESSCSSIMELPNVVWHLLFKLIPQKTLVEHRLVSKKWKENIDEFATLQIDFFDHLRPETLDRIFELRIRTCSFHMLNNTFEPRFMYPLLIKDITLSNVSSENLIRILTTCTHVEILRFFSTLVMNKQFEPDKDYSKVLQLRKLQTLQVGIHTIGQRNANAKSSIFDTLIVGNIRVLHFDALEKLNVCFSMTPEEWIQLFDFISRHATTLNSLELRCMCSDNMCNRSDFSAVNLNQLTKKLNLRSLIIRCDSASRISTLHSVFNDIVDSQRSLECINVHYAGLKYSSLLSVLTKSKATLRSVRFEGVESGFGEHCDGTALGNCSVLKEFFLDYVEKTYIVVPVESPEIYMGTAEHSAVSELCLPKSLTCLSWNGLWIKTEEIIKICDSLECPLALNSLVISNVGFNEDYGVTVETFVAMCKRFPELEMLEVGKLNLGPEERNENWDNIVQRATALEIYKSKMDFDNSEKGSVFQFVDSQKKKEFLVFLGSLEF